MGGIDIAVPEAQEKEPIEQKPAEQEEPTELSAETPGDKSPTSSHEVEVRSPLTVSTSY